MSEFASQTVGQYYNIMAMRKATKYVDIWPVRERLSIEQEEELTGENGDEESVYTMRGEYVVDINPDKTVHVQSKKSKEIEKHRLDATLVTVLHRLSMLDDDQVTQKRFHGYTHATVFGSNGESASYNAHPFYYGEPWYDWAHVY